MSYSLWCILQLSKKFVLPLFLPYELKILKKGPLKTPLRTPLGTPYLEDPLGVLAVEMYVRTELFNQYTLLHL